MDLGIKGLRVLVTAGASGIGLEISRAFVREGARVHICDVDSQALAAVAKSDPALTQSVCDVSDRAQVSKLIDDALKSLGGLDCLVNNAGWTRRVPHRRLEDLTDEIWERVLATNLRGPFYCARAAVPHMERRAGGAIVNITSVAGATGTGSSMAYAASKGGLDTLTKSLARALAPSRIRVNAVAPSLLDTGFGGGFITPDVLAQTGRFTPIGRPVTVEEVAQAVVFLLGHDATTGYTSIVDGGLTALGPMDPAR